MSTVDTIYPVLTGFQLWAELGYEACQVSVNPGDGSLGHRSSIIDFEMRVGQSDVSTLSC